MQTFAILVTIIGVVVAFVYHLVGSRLEQRTKAMKAPLRGWLHIGG